MLVMAFLQTPEGKARRHMESLTCGELPRLCVRTGSGLEEERLQSVPFPSCGTARPTSRFALYPPIKAA